MLYVYIFQDKSLKCIIIVPTIIVGTGILPVVKRVGIITIFTYFRLETPRPNGVPYRDP